MHSNFVIVVYLKTEIFLSFFYGTDEVVLNKISNQIYSTTITIMYLHLNFNYSSTINAILRHDKTCFIFLFVQISY